MNIGGSEIVLIAILALILFGPKRLPEIGRQVGRAIAEVRKVSREFEREVKDAIEPLEREVRDAEAVARKTYELNPDHSSFITKQPRSDIAKPDEPPQG